MSDCQIIAFAITGESLGIESEAFLWAKIKNKHTVDFLNHIDRINFNRRRKRLYLFIEELNRTIASFLNEGEDCFPVDSIPTPVCKNAREQRSRICIEHFEMVTNKVYSAVNKTWYYGYKLHLLTSAGGVYQSMDLIKASVHDVYYLSHVKHSGLNNCILLGDKGYLSSSQQLDLFTSCNVKLETPMRTNQKDYTLYPPVFKKFRKRIETLFSQLCDQFMLKRNYAKTLVGLSV
jgi:hypothetical protein